MNDTVATLASSRSAAPKCVQQEHVQQMLVDVAQQAFKPADLQNKQGPSASVWQLGKSFCFVHVIDCRACYVELTERISTRPQRQQVHKNLDRIALSFKVSVVMQSGTLTRMPWSA